MYAEAGEFQGALPMNDKDIQSLEAAAGALIDHLNAMAPAAKEVAEECRIARESLAKILGPSNASGNTSPLAAEARAVLEGSTQLNERLLALNAKADAIYKVAAGAMNEISHVAYELSLIEDAGEKLSIEDHQRLGHFSRFANLTQAEWKLQAGNAILQVHSLLVAYDKLLLAYVGQNPARRLDVAGAAKEVADKLRDALKDGLVFPGYSKLEKLFRTLTKTHIEKEANALRQAIDASSKVRQIQKGIDALTEAFNFAEASVVSSGRALLDSIDAFEAAQSNLLGSLRRAPGDTPRER